MIAGFGLTRSLLVRHRTGLSVTLAYAVLGSLTLLALGGTNMPPLGSTLIFLGLMLACFYLLAVFLHSDSDVATPGSTYPAHYFTLPVRTADLVLWPVLSGVVLVGGLTYLVGTAIHRSGFGFDEIAATLVIVTLLTSMQAVFWFPIGIPYSKLILSISVIVGLFFITLSPQIWRTSTEVRELLLLLTTAVSVGVTWLGVAKARAGGSVAGAIRPSITLLPTKVDQPAFSSPFQGQVWYEWRQQGRVLPLMATFLFVVFLIPGYWSDTLSPIHGLSGPNRTTPTVSTFLSVYYPLIIVLIPIFAWVVGFGMKRTELKRNDGSFHLFFSTRPLQDETLLWAKMKVALRSVATTWALIVAGSLPLLLTSAGTYSNGVTLPEKGTVLSVLPQFIGAEAIAMTLVGVAILFFFTWRNFVVGFWTELSGVMALRYLQPFASVVIYLALAVIPPVMQRNLFWLPWVLGSLLVLKLGLAAFLAVDLRRRGIIEDRSLLLVIGGYVVFAVALGSAACYLLGPVIVESKENYLMYSGSPPLATTLNVVLAAMWYVPISRILLAVKALSANRHR